MQCETFIQKWKKTDIDWAQHIKMDYTQQNLRKAPKKAKQA